MHQKEIRRDREYTVEENNNNRAGEKIVLCIATVLDSVCVCVVKTKVKEHK